jgi:hypothetical protein
VVPPRAASATACQLVRDEPRSFDRDTLEPHTSSAPAHINFETRWQASFSAGPSFAWAAIVLAMPMPTEPGARFFGLDPMWTEQFMTTGIGILRK